METLHTNLCYGDYCFGGEFCYVGLLDDGYDDTDEAELVDADEVVEVGGAGRHGSSLAQCDHVTRGFFYVRILISGDDHIVFFVEDQA